jgi:Iodothyronine deiodinase
MNTPASSQPSAQSAPSTGPSMSGGMTGSVRDDDVPGVDARNTTEDTHPAPLPPRSTVGGRLVGKLTIGEPAPELSAVKVEGGSGPLRLNTLKSRPTLLVFGSYSAPTFRAKAPDLEKLRTKYGSVANIWLIYTREAFPAAGWDVERNRDAKIRAEQPTTLAARITAAQAARKELKLTLPLAVDDISDATSTAYGLMPNGAVVLDKKGIVAAAQQFFDGYAADRFLESLIKNGGLMGGTNDVPSTRP